MASADPPPSEPDPGPDPRDITLLLREASQGRPHAVEDLLPHVYDQLRRTAQKCMLDERREHTLQATALVHEAYLRLTHGVHLPWRDRAHFYFAAAEAMRRILIEHARARARLKRGGDGVRPHDRVPLDDIEIAAPEVDCDQILRLDAALRRLEEDDPQAAQVVRLRYFAGLSVDDTASALEISSSTVDREWAYARAKLRQAMRQPAG